MSPFHATKLLIFSSLFCLVFLSASSQAADLRIAVADIDKIFNDYYKTRDAANEIEDQRARAKREVNQYLLKLEKLIKEHNNIQKKITEVSEAEKNALREDAKDIRDEAQKLEAETAELQQRRERQIETEMATRRQEIFKTIFDTVNEKGKEFDLILDRSGAGLSRMPLVLRVNTEKIHDLTPEVISELNRDAPQGFIPGAPATLPEPGTSVLPATPVEEPNGLEP